MPENPKNVNPANELKSKAAPTASVGENKDSSPEAEILDNLPPEAKKMVEMAISMQSITGRASNPILQKITEDHITKILDQSSKEEDYSYKDTQSSKFYHLIYFVLIITLIVFFVVYLADRDKELLKNLADKALYILGGFGGGYGFKAYRDNKKKA